MPRVTTVDKGSEKSCEATGHPSECTEPVPGQVQRRETHNVTVTNASGVTKQIATIKSADMFFEKHSHDYVAEDGCHDDESHSLDPKVDNTASFTINKSPAYVVEDDVVSDPKTGDAVNIIEPGINNSLNNNL